MEELEERMKQLQDALKSARNTHKVVEAALLESIWNTRNAMMKERGYEQKK